MRDRQDFLVIKMKLKRFSFWGLTALFLTVGCGADVRTGLDDIGSYQSLFRGQRVGIITNNTAYNRKNEFILDLFQKLPEVSVTALFAPEHGISGVEDFRRTADRVDDPAFEIPIYSLYGEHLKPTAEMLQDVDILVFDVQEVGVRFYTKTSTLSLALEAAAEQGKLFVVLDRPNPINGVQVEGNVLEPEFSSFIGLHPIPVRYGMTKGELARMYNEEGWLKDGVRAELAVIEMKNWRRRYWYDQTGLPFIRTSPNMPDLETATVYPGVCLLEGTNVSEGRGTNMPFLQFGAPWIEGEQLADRLNELEMAGIHFEAVSFTPTSSKYENEKCNGVKIMVRDRDRFEPYWCGINIVNIIYRMYPEAFQWRDTHFDRLCGSGAVREAIISGASLDELRAGWQEALNRFLRIRKKYLLYTR